MPLTDDFLRNQQHRFLCWNGEIANDLLLVALKGEESIFSPYLYEVRSFTRLDESSLSRWHGKHVSCRIGDGNEKQPQRFLHGVITRIQYTQLEHKEAECILILEPDLALLKMGRAMRVWQNIQVPDLVRTVLKESGISQVDFQLHGDYPKREYCIQYRESAFDFIHRVLEEEGIYYFFRHSESGHTLVFADHPSCHPAIENHALAWHHNGNVPTRGGINRWESAASLLPGSVSLSGFNMSQASVVSDRLSAGTRYPHVNTVSFADITPQGERSLLSRQAKSAMAAREANTLIHYASVNNAHWLSSGEVFALTGHPAGETTYRIHTLNLEVINNVDNTSSDCQCHLQAMSNEYPWKPPVQYPAPEISGVLIATVTGPASEEIHTDKYGRVKIQFPWDNHNPGDDTSSCWVRVNQPWAGVRFGGQFVPRVGSEVLVSFVQGHPDHPVIVGALYNGQNQPPFKLPEEKHESGFVTRSAAKSSVEEGHQLSFNDKKGDEKLTVVAQKNLQITVKNDATYTIAANRNTELSKGDDRLVLKEGNVVFTLEKGNWQQRVAGNVTTELKNGDYELKVAGGRGEIKTDKVLTFESQQSVEFKVGSTKISLTQAGITLSAAMVKIDCDGSTELKGASVKISSTGLTEVKGTMVSINGTANTEVKGAMTTISGSAMTQVSGAIVMIG